jgi:signal transduction histidine kinase
MRVSTMGELAASLAHELNQPLTAILSNAQAAQRFMAIDTVDLTEVREILNDIVQDNNRASEVIRRIRALLKKGEREIALLDPGALIRDAVQLLHNDVPCVHMSYLQLALLHIPAIVVHGNTLSVQEWSHWYTPAHVLGGWRGRLARERDQAAPQDTAVATTENGAAVLVPVELEATSTPDPAAIDFGKLEQLALF